MLGLRCCPGGLSSPVAESGAALEPAVLGGFLAVASLVAERGFPGICGLH